MWKESESFYGALFVDDLEKKLYFKWCSIVILATDLSDPHNLLNAYNGVPSPEASPMISNRREYM